MLKGYLQYFAPNTRIRQADAKTIRSHEEMFHAHDIAGSGLVCKDDLVTVTAFENCHFHPDDAALARSQQDKSFAFRFQTPDKVIVFNGDAGKSDGMREFARGTDFSVA